MVGGDSRGRESHWEVELEARIEAVHREVAGANAHGDRVVVAKVTEFSADPRVEEDSDRLGSLDSDLLGGDACLGNDALFFLLALADNGCLEFVDLFRGLL